jgi:methionine synthase II (cobalamin-independent)
MRGSERRFLTTHAGSLPRPTALTEAVADRLRLVAQAVGDPRRVIAGTDCGLETSAGVSMACL